MTSTLVRRTAAWALVAGMAGASFAAETTSRSTSSSRPTPTSAARSGKGPLPDPTLLDGSTHPPEKRSEQGMIGDFELPGDDNARSGKVGGQQGGAQPQPGVQVDVPVPGLPSPGGQSAASAAGAQGLPQLPQPGQSGQQGGQAAGGTQSGAAAGGAGDPNAKAEGIQVAQLGGEGSSQDAIGGDKPPPVAIGDSAMKIQTAGVGTGVVGAQQIGINTQQHEKGTGSGGKGTGGASGGPNRTEKGRTMPAGL